MKKFYLYIMLVFTSVISIAQSGDVKGLITVENDVVTIACVRLLNTGYTVITNEQGFFILKNIPAKTYHLQIDVLGYAPHIQIVKIEADKTLDLGIIVLEEEVFELKEVVITATRTERNIEDVPIPVTVISNEQIEDMGSMRLSDVLAEQTGLTIVSDHGTGIQLQGYDSDYTLIMINGQPLVGRTAGTFDLDRISINNIKQIEITKGPSSSLYGSEALAGVINIITDEPKTPFEIGVSTKYRTYNTSDVSVNITSKYKKLNATFQVNNFASSGYDLTPETLSRTAPEFSSSTFNTQLGYKLNKKIALKLNGRYYNENQENKTIISDDVTGDQQIDMKANQNDWNLAPSLIYKFTPHSKLTVINYTTGYNTLSDYTYNADGTNYETSFFNQLYNKSEAQADIRLNKTNVLTTGGGLIVESLNSDRYAGLDNFYTRYAFVQDEWMPFKKKLTVIAGGRFDSHSEYSQQLSPKLALQYKPKKWVSVRGAFGTGFKAPDFRQLFLNFTNPTVGYSVFGSSIVKEGIQELENTGQIQKVLIDYNTIETIEAESSVSYNFGFDLKPNKNVKLRFNFFRNDITNLIESAPVAVKTNGQQVYSYFNLNKVYTQGVETALNWKPKKSLHLSVGYQYLEAKDKAVIEKLNGGNVFARDNNNQVVRVNADQYGGLFNRSKHSGNAKLFYKNKKHKFNVNIRTVYRGAYGFGDLNGNAILDAENEYVDGYFTWYFSVSKKLLKQDQLQLQFGVDNVFSNTNQYVPTMPGRLLYVGARFRFVKKASNTPTNK